MFNKRNKKRGFTLIELIIVIAIIAILAAIAVPAFGKIREKANVSADLGNARTIYSLVATELASGNIADTTVLTALDNVALIDGTTFESKIDPTPIVKTYQGADFAITITDGDIAVYALEGNATKPGGEDKALQIYPAGEGKYSTSAASE